MEARVARIESDAAHLCMDMAEVRQDVRALRDKLDGAEIRLTEKVESLEARLTGKMDSLEVRLAARMDAMGQDMKEMDVRLTRGIGRAEVRGVLLYITGFGSVLGLMAHGFGWL
ncbi:MAG TPA: hypothetical protein VMH77_10035 [Steroidobacteraceae bacterium]|nr:hypothetical protein [Steroidobacteraceae bacterium]